jgi:hypothetical protein
VTKHVFCGSARDDEEWLVDQVRASFAAAPPNASVDLTNIRLEGSYPATTLHVSFVRLGKSAEYVASVWADLYDPYPYGGEHPQLDVASVIEALDVGNA